MPRRPTSRTIGAIRLIILGNVVGGRPIKYLNLPSESLKRISIAQLSDGEPVWFGCDVGKMLLGDRGIMGMKTFEYEPLLDVSFGLDKAGRLDYGVSAMTHAMVFLGVNVVDGKPNRWKVENSWGDKSGQDGYYLMTDEWFDEYNYQVVVDKMYLTDEEWKAYQSEPIHLNPWDPMGSLA
jgi:bleomycin hydrolase